MRRTIALLAATVMSTLAAAPALAESATTNDAWSEIRAQLYADRALAPGAALIALDAPYRTQNDLRTPLGAEVHAPDGARIKSVALIIDNNPMPVSAVFDLAEPLKSFAFSAEMRVNGPSPMHVVLETDAGELFVAETFVKTSGVGACAAPPVNDPAVALERLGEMELSFVTPPASGAATTADLRGPAPRARLSIRHPSNSGLQMNQITLLYITARYIDAVEVRAGDRPYFTMTGSISLSEDPAIEFEIPSYAETLNVRMVDTEEAEAEQTFPVFAN